eukprot:6168576-Pleurochrysis_carterae.AAC.2
MLGSSKWNFAACAGARRRGGNASRMNSCRSNRAERNGSRRHAKPCVVRGTRRRQHAVRAK